MVRHHLRSLGFVYLLPSVCQTLGHLEIWQNGGISVYHLGRMAEDPNLSQHKIVPELTHNHVPSMHTRSEPLPYDGLANGGYAVSAQSGSKRPLNNPNRILIKKVTSLYNYEIKLLNYIKLYHIIMFSWKY